MAKQNQPAPSPAPALGGEPAGKGYEVIGLQQAATMPMRLGNVTYDLAALSDEELAYLLSLPEAVPYLKRIV